MTSLSFAASNRPATRFVPVNNAWKGIHRFPVDQHVELDLLDAGSRHARIHRPVSPGNALNLSLKSTRISLSRRRTPASPAGYQAIRMINLPRLSMMKLHDRRYALIRHHDEALTTGSRFPR